MTASTHTAYGFAPNDSDRTVADLLARQREREVRAVEEGKRRFLARLGRYPGRSLESRKYAKRYFDRLERLIEKDRKEARSARGQGNRPRWHKPILQMPSDTLALITLWCLVEQLARPRSLDDASQRGRSMSSLDARHSEHGLLNEIARTLRLEHFSSWLRSQESHSTERDQRWADRARSAGERKRRFEFSERAYLGWSSVADDDWFYLAQVLEARAKDVELVRTEERGAKGQITIRLDPGAFELLEAIAPPYHKPMIVEPVPWTWIRGGGYRWVPQDLDFVKHWDNRSVVDALKTAKLRRVYKVTNILQETPWRINEWIYEVATDMRRRRKNFPGVPTANEVTAAKRDWHHLKAKAESHGTTTAWSEAAYARGRFERLGMKRFVERTLLRDRLEMSEELLRENTNFFFPYQLDFRGRTYAVPRCFNPQSDDLGRALLRFSDGELLNSRGRFWLAVHVANQWGHGYDKLPFPHRYHWVQQERALIECAADNPLEEPALSWWTTAKKPWRFLAACKEWTDCLRNGDHFKSYLPIAMDGTCNGFQHLSAMLLNRSGCEATNICPNRSPRDVYSEVAAKLKTKLEADATTGQRSHRQLAKYWLDFGIDRDVVKVPAMITPYGAERGTKQKELEEMLERKRKALGDRMSTNTVRKMARYLIGPLDECIDDTCQAHQSVEEWLKSVASVLAGRGIYELVEQKLAKQLHVHRGELDGAVWREELGMSSRGSQIPVGAASRFQSRLLDLVRGCLSRDVRSVKDKRLTRVAQALAGKYIYRRVRKVFMAGIADTAANSLGHDTKAKVFSLGMRGGLYDAKKGAVRNQRLQRLVEIIRQDASVTKNDAPRLSADLVSLLKQCMDETCENPTVRALVRSWLHKDLVGLAPRGKPVQWTSPVGFPIVQAEWVYREKSVGSRLYGSSYTDQDKTTRLGIDASAQRRGITPNFVHSYDAAHLMLTVESLHKQGLRHFAVIHDSFAVHASDVDMLNSTLRKTFFHLYERDVLKRVWQELRRTYAPIAEALKQPPHRGKDMRIDAVLRSKYLFS